ncbi:putative PurR-regulated permease PerM [Zhongshania antarctica]|uniref:Putative PurR-regulated permease PerM n=1 Tax=Zhongshania antarctica TaxID=641702 RepID=A0A840RA93_9GAMM|nr:AI-2E family transporter [Zhongshania antarctica]MBB5189221.1 putative PurR-regulated permease PerM [Zhongshania antarctica]
MTTSLKEGRDDLKQSLKSKHCSGLFFLAGMYTLYFASSLWIPIVIALLLALLLSPLVTFLHRIYIPRSLSAALLLIAIGGPFTFLGMQLVEPAQKWIERVPEVSAKLNQQITNIAEVLAPPNQKILASEAEQKTKKKTGLLRFFGWTDDEVPPLTPPEPNTAVSDRLALGGLDIAMKVLAETPILLAQFLVCIILAVFLLVYGPSIYRTALEVVPQFQDKVSWSRLVKDTQRELSRYILCISLINTGLGLATATTLWLFRLEDPLLWGAMVALFNFAPYVGTIFSLAILGMAGVAQYGLVGASLLPALAFFILNLVESQLVTPAVLGRNMRMNPLVIMLWLMLWGWLWGVAGVLIAVPLLVCIKLILSQSAVFDHWVKLIESRAVSD